MSISRLRKSRGYSIAAALVLIALLVIAAVAIQSTIPSVTSPSSQSAATAASTNLSSDPTVGAGVVANEQSQATKQLAQACSDAIAACQKDPADCESAKNKTVSTASDNVDDNCVGAVPDGTTVVNGAKQVKYRCTGRSATVTITTGSAPYPNSEVPDLSGNPGSTQIKSFPDGTMTPGQCKTIVCQPQTSLISSATQLKCGTAATLAGLNQNNLNGVLGSASTFTMTQGSAANTYVPSSSIDPSSQKIIDSVYGNTSANSGAVSASTDGTLSAPASDQILGVANTSPDATTQQAQQQITALTCENGNPAACGNNSTLTPGGSGYQGPCPNGSAVGPDGNCPSSASGSAQGPCPDGSAVQADGSCKSSGVQQGPCPSGGAVSADGKCNSTFTPPPTTGGGSGGTGGGTATGNGNGTGSGGGLGNTLGNLFGQGNNNNAANNTPQSPFGGACNTRYVCQGNTLYYQAVSGGFISGSSIVGQQCQTQPVQQCPYGCMAVTGTTGTQSSLSNIGTDLQAFASILNVFGGGSNNTTLANQNLSSQCAMTPQQSQNPPPSPYGTGTNGQQCYQPPPQPDPAQCTAGTWQPTSAQQNGCTTGYQCVPTGGGSQTPTTPTTPSAQLSCQPQIADVGTPISFSFSCGSATASKGTGFDTAGALSGTATTPAPTPPSGTNQATFSLTCQNQGVTASAQCQVQLNKPGIVLVTNSKTTTVGASSLIGWITAGMQSCVISSPDDQDFTARNAGNVSTNGAATTSPLTAGDTRFQLDCQTLAGASKSATTTVTAN